MGARSGFDIDLNNITPPNPSNVKYLTDANVDWDISQFFDLHTAALESTTHGPASAEPFSHNGTPIGIPAQPTLNDGFSALSKRPRAASGFEGQGDGIVAQHTVTMN